MRVEEMDEMDDGVGVDWAGKQALLLLLLRFLWWEVYGSLSICRSRYLHRGR